MPKSVESIDRQEPLPAGAVDVNQLCQELSVEDLASSADEYFRSQLDGIDGWQAKPYWNAAEAPHLTTVFGQALASLKVLPGMRVLDFGAGSGWTSRYLTQMGCEVVVLDVSPTALGIAEDLYQRLPIIGEKPLPQFLHFDGHTIDLEDASVDRILCFDSFHHAPNPAEVLSEMGRVLRAGGRAVFSEPGPNHSRSSQSQYEMRNYTVVENDVLIREVEKWSKLAGFDRLELAVFNPAPFHITPEGYERLLAGRSEIREYMAQHYAFLRTQRQFVLYREGCERLDSRTRDGLAGNIAVQIDKARVSGSSALTGCFTVENSGVVDWILSVGSIGGVGIGVRLFGQSGALISRDFVRVNIDGPSRVPPGSTLSGKFSIVPPDIGAYVLEFDLVAEGVLWFEMNGTIPVRIPIEVVDV